LNVTLQGIGPGTFVVASGTRVLSANGAPLVPSEISAGDHLQATGSPDPSTAGVYDVTVVHDLDVSSQTVTGTVMAVDDVARRLIIGTASGDMTLTLAPGTRITGTSGAGIKLASLSLASQVEVTGLEDTRTSTFVRVASIHETLTPFSLAVVPSAPAVHPGGTETLAVTTVPNADATVTVMFPDGESQTLHGKADGNGDLSIDIPVPLEAFAIGIPQATVNVQVGRSPNVHADTVTFLVKLPGLAVLVTRSRLRVGGRQEITALSRPRTALRLTLLWPNRSVWHRVLETDSHGVATYSFAIPAHHLSSSDQGKVAVTLTRGRRIKTASFTIRR
jgi:hypothetical protein